MPTFVNIGAATADSQGVDLSAPGGANTKGAWTELTSSLPSDIVGFIVSVICTGGSGDNGILVDIGAGGSGPESAIIGNLPLMRATGNPGASFHAYIPRSIASGTRLSARYQATNSANVSMSMIGAVGSSALINTCSSVDSYGGDTATSLGAVVDPGGSANTKGAYTQLTASLSNAIGGAILCVTSDPSSQDEFWLMDVATGGSGSETVVVPNIQFSGSFNNQYNVKGILLPLELSAGTRVAVRCQSSQTTATRRNLHAVLLGLVGVTGGSAAGLMYRNSGLSANL